MNGYNARCKYVAFNMLNYDIRLTNKQDTTIAQADV